MASLSRKTVLTISRDRPLQRTRTLILQEAGYTVVELRSDAEVLRWISTAKEIHLVVMCHSVPEKSRALLAEAIKIRCPGVPILMLGRDWDARPARVDAFIDVSEATPASWL